MSETNTDLAQYQSDHDLLVRIDERTTTLHTKVDKLTDDHETRIRTLEKEANRWIGKQSIIGGMIGVAAAFISAFVEALFLLHK
jgi:hypothetical protein